MATASIPGFKASLYLASSSAGGNPSSSGAALVKLGELAEATLTLQMGAMDATSKDSAGWKEALAGLREWGITGSGMYLLETSDPGQLGVYNVLQGQAPVYLQLYETSSGTIAPKQIYSGTAIVTAFDVESPLDKPAGFKLTLKGTAALTKAAATS